MIVIAVTLLGLSLAALCVALGLIQTTDAKTRERLVGVESGGVHVANDGRTGLARLQFEGPEDAARLVIPMRLRTRLERNLMLAGYPAGWTWQKILILKIAAPLILAVAMREFAFSEFSMVNTTVGVGSVIVAYLLPDLLLSSRARERQAAMELELPDALDKIVISLESGLGFESALMNAAETGKGDFADELVRTLQDIQVGMPRRAAYEALVNRTESEDIRRFVRSLIQAEETGVSVSTVVRNQSADMRMKRKLRAEGKAQQVSVKLLFPLIFCLFPVLFVIVLAPGVMTAIEGFKGL
ncbi:bacterial type II secretion system domain protein F [Aeromicrobium marinum DSM 15272]|uniref:Bacterial type II secretion system domain protein F n=1 Tax=Aeromicrobium marinum DSM 15272 TaxID=585531 RepID=E2SDL7_9ACTN|nr:type II secretion system F family protein [Aeromicrobium marinum]EFQ82594.1 bacterial type II secretion system domain protein F [Aeromicrobium marinum DSM 15272]